MKILLKTLIKYLPNDIKSLYYRKCLNLNFSNSCFEGLELKEAETQEEFEQAFRLVQSEYRKRTNTGAKEGTRLTKFHLLPTTVVLVAKRSDKVVGTISLILDTVLGLPSDELTSLSKYRKRGWRIAEVSSLAVSQKERQKSNITFFLLAVYFLSYAKNSLACDFIVGTLSHNISDFYKHIFLFKYLKKNKQKHVLSDSADSVPMILDVRQFPLHFKNVYSKSLKGKNLYEFIMSDNLKDIIKDKNNKFNIVGGVNSKRNYILKLLKSNKNKLQDILSVQDLIRIESFYSDKDIIYEELKEISTFKRNSVRIYTNIQFEIFDAQANKYVTCICRQVSLTGICIKFSSKSELGEMLKFKINSGSGISFLIHAEIVWNNGNVLGLKVLEGLETWKSFYYEIFTWYEEEKEISQQENLKLTV